MKTQRKYTRKTSTNDVSFTVEGVEYQGTCSNIGAGGLMIETEDTFSVGQPMELSLRLSSQKKHVTFHATIIRVTKGGIAVRFTR